MSKEAVRTLTGAAELTGPLPCNPSTLAAPRIPLPLFFFPLLLLAVAAAPLEHGARGPRRTGAINAILRQIARLSITTTANSNKHYITTTTTDSAITAILRQRDIMF